MRNWIPQEVWICAFLLVVGQSIVAGESDPSDRGFSMESTVYDDANGEVLGRTTTLFIARSAYDIVHGDPPDIAKFDFNNHQVHLLSRKRRQQTTIPFPELLKFQIELERRARSNKDQPEFGSFLADPKFVREHDVVNSVLTLRSPWMTYRAKLVPTRGETITTLTEFSDWSARLAGILTRAAPPAAPRLALNLSMKHHDRWAEQITREGRFQATIHSRHALVPELSDRDKSLVSGIEKDLKDFPRVLFSDYLNARFSMQPVTMK